MCVVCWSVCWSVVSDGRGHHPTLNPDGARLLLLLILHFPRGHASSSQHTTGGMVPIEAWSTVARVGSWGVVCCSCCLPVGERALRGPPESPPCFSFSSLSLHPSLPPSRLSRHVLLFCCCCCCCLLSSCSCLVLLLCPPAWARLPPACLPSCVVVLRWSGWSAAPGPQAPRGNVCLRSVGRSVVVVVRRSSCVLACVCACGGRGWWGVMWMIG